jgi:hypothetical protein
MSSADAGAHYTSMLSAKEQIQKEAEQGLWGTDQMEAWLAYMTNKSSEEIAKMSREERKSLYETSMKNANRYFTEDETGIYNMYQDIVKIGDSEKDLNDVISVFDDGT